MKKVRRKLAVLLTMVMLVGCLAMSMLFGCSKKPNGEIYTLEEVYKWGLISREDLMSIAYYQNGGRDRNESIMNENYNPVPKNPEELNKTMESDIKQYFVDYLNRKYNRPLTKEDIKIEQYYGSYNGCYAIMQSDHLTGYQEEEKEINIDGVYFLYNNSNRIKIWIDSILPAKQNRQVFSLKVAYEYGLLSKKDLMSIAYYQNGGREENKSIMSKRFKPQPKNPATLEQTVELQIKEYYTDYYRNLEKFPQPEATVKDICIEQYYGCYNGYYAIMQSDRFTNYTESVTKINIGGVNFVYANSNGIIVWKEK